MWIRQLFGGSIPPKYLTDVDPSNIWGVYTPEIFDGCMSVKFLGGLHMQIFDGCGSVKYLGHLDPKNI